MTDTPSDHGSNWKLDLRYGRATTPFSHHAVIAEVEVLERTDRNGADPGPAFMGFRAWATDNDELAEMTKFFVREFGCRLTGRTYFYTTEPEEPPRERPHGYGFNFTPFLEETDQ